MGQVLTKKIRLQPFLENGKLNYGRSFHQLGTVKVKFFESNFVPLGMAP